MNVHFSSATDLWATPQDLFDRLDEAYHFTLDPCSTHDNAKCARHYVKDQDGLAQNWDGETVFMNPPYGREIGHWVAKAVHSKATVVMLLPARTDTRWFHHHLYRNPKVTLEFLRGRLKFGAATNSAPFPSLIAHYRHDGFYDPAGVTGLSLPRGGLSMRRTRRTSAKSRTSIACPAANDKEPGTDPTKRIACHQK